MTRTFQKTENDTLAWVQGREAPPRALNVNRDEDSLMFSIDDDTDDEDLHRFVTISPDDAYQLGMWLICQARAIGLSRACDPAEQRILRLTMADMPAAPDDIGWMLDRAQARHKLESRNAVWRAIGVSPKRGRDLLTRANEHADWPVFMALRDMAIGGAT